MVKTFYDLDGKPISFDVPKMATTGGTNASVYDLGDGTALKQFDIISKRNIVDINVFTELMGMDFEHYYKVYQILYADYFNDSLRERFKDRSEMIWGYVMKWYVEAVNNILDMPMDYFLSSFNGLIEMLKKFTKMHINVCDMQSYNLVLTKDRIIVVDADAYFRDYSENLFDKNKAYMYYGIYSLLAESLCHNYNLPHDINSKALRLIYALFYNSLDLFDVNDFANIKNSVRTYKKPIDYIYANVNR